MNPFDSQRELSTLARCMSMLAPHKGKIVFAIFLSLLASVFAIASGYMLRILVDFVLVPQRIA